LYDRRITTGPFNQRGNSDMINPKNTRGRASKGQPQDALARQYGGIGIAAVAAATSVKASNRTKATRKDQTVQRLLDSVTE
jgi:hypothetical protein